MPFLRRFAGIACESVTRTFCRCVRPRIDLAMGGQQEEDDNLGKHFAVVRTGHSLPISLSWTFVKVQKVSKKS